MSASSPINRREFSKQLVTGIGGALLAPTLATAANKSVPTTSAGSVTKPNIVYVLSDQHAYKYCGFMGHPIVRTPNLDRIAARGTVFRNTYCCNPLCAPSRAGMLAGVYGSDVNSFCNSTVTDGSLPAWPALLRDAGYLTYGVGKMDVNPHFDMGFSQSGQIGNQHVNDPDITSLFRRPLCARIGERELITGGARDVPLKIDARFFDVALEFIRGRKSTDGPWSVYCGLNMPHPPFVGLRSLYEGYLKQVDLPNIPPGHLEDLHFSFQQLRHFKNIATPIPEERLRQARAAYFAMITELDDHIGKVWKALEETGQLEQTVFVYSSDHGEALGEHGLWMKGNLYDVAARVPLVIAGAGIPSGKVVDTPVAHVDLIRTFLDLGGAATHAKLRGHSLLPMLRGEPGDHPGWAFSETHSDGNCTGSFLIRKGDWKYIHITWHDGLLFNLAEDPGEFHNRIADPAAQETLRELQAILYRTVDPVEVTERGFAVQSRLFERLEKGKSPEQMLDLLRSRLGEGQSVGLLNARYGHTFPYTHQLPKVAAPS